MACAPQACAPGGIACAWPIGTPHPPPATRYAAPRCCAWPPIIICCAMAACDKPCAAACGSPPAAAHCTCVAGCCCCAAIVHVRDLCPRPPQTEQRCGLFLRDECPLSTPARP